MAEGFSFMIPAGYQRSSCGYCHSKPKRTRQPASAQYGAISSSVRPDHYQLLVDRGWRRSGRYYYKPDNRHHCCPHYTIRLDAKAFESRRDQRQTINRWNDYVLGQDYRYKAARFCPLSREQKRRRKTIFDLGDSVHRSEYEHVKRPMDTRTTAPIEPAHKFEVNLEPDKFTEEKFALFQHYQKFIHKEDSKSQTSFTSFLCDGLGQTTIESNGKTKRLGSYHQCYRLNGRLVAMGVLDLLPDCVSSVYLIYHEDVSDWQFGKLSAMREIQLAIEEDYGYYYMGYYIHSCVKMRYKGDFRPTYLLDPVSYSWDPLNPDLLQRLSARRFVSLTVDHHIGVPASPDDLSHFMNSASSVSGLLYSPLEMGNLKYERAIDYVKGDADENEKPPKGVFDSGMPGAMSLDELRDQIDLGTWLIQIKDQITTLENLVAWDEGDISDPQSVKGFVAPFAACLGPELMAVVIVKFGF